MAKAAYTGGSMEGTMLKTAAAMLPATLAFSGYNIADTYFVSRLGTIPLAAMGFTFPVIMLIGCVNRGLGTGSSTPLAHAMGCGNRTKAARIASAGLMLVLLWASLIGICGYLSIHWTFRQFGAGDEVMPLIAAYMRVWYLGCLASAISMTCNGILISAGCSKTASTLMLGGLFLNVILDPILIFGLGPVPALGIKGAAIATVISQFTVALVQLSLLQVKLKLLNFTVLQRRLLGRAWYIIMRMAIPSIIGMLMMPIGNGIMTRIVAAFGNDAVAACAAAGRLEIVAFIIPMALGISLTPIIAQNFGGRHIDRIDRCRRFAMRFALGLELLMAIVYFFAAPWVAQLFSDKPDVVRLMTLYLRIIPWGFGFMEVHRYAGFFFTGCNRPASAAMLNALRIVVLLVPFSMVALFYHSLPGLFAARLAADSLSGIIGILLVKHLLVTLKQRSPGSSGLVTQT